MSTFTGLAVALATPFTQHGELDIDAYQRLVSHVVAGEVDFLVALGSTGEAAVLTAGERDIAIRACIEAAEGQPVVVGTGHNATAQAVEMTRRAADLGAAGALVVTPYYNKPTPDGLVRHYEAVAAAAPDLPLIVYNVPGRTGLNLAPSTLTRLWDNPQVVAVKESSGDLPQIAEIARTLPAGKGLLAGDDNMAVAAIAVGAAGLVSVVGNLLPAPTKVMVDAARRSDVGTARSTFHRLLPLMDALFAESNPIPLKAGLAMLGLATEVVRAPLAPASESTRRGVRDALESLGALGSS